MTESPIEKHLVKLVKKAGGLCYKWVSPGNVGVPDRIVFFNGGIFLVETKSTTGKLRVMQTKQKEWLAERGAEVVVLNSKAKVESWVDMQVRAIAIYEKLKAAI
jgi:hypothetical protein